MPRTTKHRYLKASNKRLTAKIEHLSKALHTLVEKGFTDELMLAELHMYKAELHYNKLQIKYANK